MAPRQNLHLNRSGIPSLDALRRRFGRPRRERRFAPLEELILTVLSQHTNDGNRDRAFASLVATFPTWDRVTRAPARAVERAIRTGGLGRTNSRVLQAILPLRRGPGWTLAARRILHILRGEVGG